MRKATKRSKRRRVLAREGEGEYGEDRFRKNGGGIQLVGPTVTCGPSIIFYD